MIVAMAASARYSLHVVSEKGVSATIISGRLNLSWWDVSDPAYIGMSVFPGVHFGGHAGDFRWLPGAHRVKSPGVLGVFIPLWVLAMPSAMMGLWLLRRPLPAWACALCGYSLEGLGVEAVCPECGASRNAPIA